MKKMFKVLVLLLALVLVLPMAACSSGGGVTKADTKEGVKELTDKFYEGLAEEDKISMTTFYSGEKYSTFILDGDVMHMEDIANSMSYYLFKENGKNYYMADGEEPVKEDVMYDITKDTIKNVLNMFVNGLLDSEETTDDDFTFASELSAKNDVSTLKTDISTEQEGETVTLTVIGTKSDSKIDSITVKQGEEELYRYEFKHNVSIELPEHEIYDPSLFYKHIDSPYATVSDVLAEYADTEDFNYMCYDENILIFTEKDGRQLQLTAPLGDLAEEYHNIDAMEDDFREKEIGMIKDLAVTDCLDYTDALLSAEEMESNNGRTVGELFDEGYEGASYMFGDTYYLELDKGPFTYAVDLSLPEGFDLEGEIDYDAMRDCVAENFRFVMPSTAYVPLH